MKNANNTRLLTYDLIKHSNILKFPGFYFKHLLAVNINSVEKFSKEVEGNPLFHDVLYAPIKDTKHKYLTDEEAFKIFGNNNVFLRNVCLSDIILFSITGKKYTSYFITDDKTNNIIGFASFVENETDIKIIDGIKIFRFDGSSVLKDIDTLCDNILESHKEINWQVHVKNKAIKCYDTILRKKKEKGFIVERKKKKTTIYYQIKTENGGSNCFKEKEWKS
jgi:hypothetical protein